MSSVDLNINNTTHYGIEEIYVPKADNSGNAIFVLSTNVVPHLDISGMVAGTAENIDDSDGFITGDVKQGALTASPLKTVILPNVKKVLYRAFYGCGTIEYAKMNSCTEIQQEAFEDCTKIEEVDFPLCTIIGVESFHNCTKLTDINMPSLTTGGIRAFWNCTSLEQASFPSLIYLSESMFAACTKLHTLNLPNVTTVYPYVFSSTPLLESVSLPSVTTLFGESQFRDSRLKSLSLPSVSGGIGNRMCQDNTSLISVSLPNVTSITHLNFYHCTSLTTVSIPNLVSIGGGSNFEGCTSLQTLEFSELTSIGNEANFKNSGLNTLILSKEQVCTLNNVNNFTGTPIANGTGYIYVPDALVNSYKAASNWSTYANQIKGLSELPQS